MILLFSETRYWLWAAVAAGPIAWRQRFVAAGGSETNGMAKNPCWQLIARVSVRARAHFLICRAIGARDCQAPTGQRKLLPRRPGPSAFPKQPSTPSDSSVAAATNPFQRPSAVLS